jgi:ribosomal protein S3
MRQGVLGIKVKIMMNLERKVGKTIKVMPDFVKIHEPKEENLAEIVPNVLFNRRGEE